MRGFRVVRDDTLELVFDKPGRYVVPEVAAPMPAAADAGPGAQETAVTRDTAAESGLQRESRDGGCPDPSAAVSAAAAASTQCDTDDSMIGTEGDHAVAAAAAAVAAKAVQAALSQGG
jgi:hypothetical protein